jgi:hypothetical protein
LASTVTNQEKLYRSVRFTECVNVVGEPLRVSASAFNDAGQMPSVDRELLRSNPEDSKLSVTDGIIKLCTLKVRNIDFISVDATRPNDKYAFDVIARPLSENDAPPSGNPAHAQIEPSPTYSNKSRFKKLKEALGQIADVEGWVIQPTQAANSSEF